MAFLLRCLIAISKTWTLPKLPDPTRCLLSQYRWELDNALRRSDLGPAFDIFNRYQAKVTARFSWVIELIDQGVDQFDLKERLIQIDRSELLAPAKRR